MERELLLAAIASLCGVVGLLWKLDRNRLKESLVTAQKIIAERERQISDLLNQKDKLLRRLAGLDRDRSNDS